jgi:hypothetical protein
MSTDETPRPRPVEAWPHAAAVPPDQAPLPEPAVEPTTPSGGGGAPGERVPPVAGAAGYRARWEDIQAAFVDEPRGAVEDADQLVVEVIDEITAELTRRRDEVRDRWHDDPAVATEDLRLTLQRYRTVLDQLLSG